MWNDAKIVQFFRCLAVAHVSTHLKHDPNLISSQIFYFGGKYKLKLQHLLPTGTISVKVVINGYNGGI